MDLTCIDFIMLKKNKILKIKEFEKELKQLENLI